jgi:hypothetical protein
MSSVSDVKSGLAIAARAYHNRSEFVGLNQPLHLIDLNIKHGLKKTQGNLSNIYILYEFCFDLSFHG